MFCFLIVFYTFKKLFCRYSIQFCKSDQIRCVRIACSVFPFGNGLPAYTISLCPTAPPTACANIQEVFFYPSHFFAFIRISVSCGICSSGSVFAKYFCPSNHRPVSPISSASSKTSPNGDLYLHVYTIAFEQFFSSFFLAHTMLHQTLQILQALVSA